jgi:hypothetical protein
MVQAADQGAAEQTVIMDLTELQAKGTLAVAQQVQVVVAVVENPILDLLAPGAPVVTDLHRVLLGHR